MKNKQKFSAFHYVVGNDFICEDKVEVKIFFLYGYKRMNKIIDIKKKKDAPESYYRDEAKKIIEQSIKDDSLKKECEKKKERKKVLSILIPTMSAMAIAGITLGCYYGLKPASNEIEVIDPEINGLVIENQTAIIGQDYDTKISLNTDLVDDCILPETLAEVKSGDDVLDASCYTYEVNEDYLSASLHIPGEYIKGAISIKLTLDEMPWYLDKKYINGLTKTDVTKEGGEIQTVKVNGIDHKVRLIGVDEDYGTIGDESTKIHTTWEFANLISDENGHSLATQWNDTDNYSVGTGTANFNYLDSSLRMALVGEKQEKGHILWAQKEETTWSKNPLYENKCVLDMLPSKLVSVLKAPSKYININDGGWGEQIIKDKLFLLSPKEMGNTGHPEREEELTTTYSYYEDAENADRVKKQTNSDDEYAPGMLVKIKAGAGQTYPNTVSNYAGFNPLTENGGYLWLRSPGIDANKSAWDIITSGAPNFMTVYGSALGIAPAFCI